MSAPNVMNLATNNVDFTKRLVGLTRIFTKKANVVASICFYKCETLEMKSLYRALFCSCARFSL